MRGSEGYTVGIDGLDTGQPTARVRRVTRDGVCCPHDRAGHRVRGQSGVQYQWCAECGALGMCGADGRVVWVPPGIDAEDMVVDVLAALR